MGSLKSLAGLIMFASNLVFAGVDDPQFILPKVDAFLGSPSFSQAFQVGDQIEYRTTECIGSFPCGSETKMNAIINSVSDSEVAILQYGSNHELKAKAQVRNEQWEAINRNYLRAKINNFASYGFEITIHEFKLITCPVENYLPPNAQCGVVSLSGVNQIKQSSTYQFVLWNSPLALGQIIASTQIDKLGVERTIKYRLLGVER